MLVSALGRPTLSDTSLSTLTTWRRTSSLDGDGVGSLGPLILRTVGVADACRGDLPVIDLAAKELEDIPLPASVVV